MISLNGMQILVGNKNRTNIVVTGSDGFIGTHLVKELKKNPNNNVFEIDRKHGEDLNYLDELLQTHEIDIIYHLAAQTSVFNNDVTQVIRDNIIGFVKVVNLCNLYKIKLIYTSSSTAHPNNVTSIYGLSKLFDEKYASMYCDFATGVRLHNVYDDDNPREGTLMWHVLNDDKITLYNNGDNKRHFTHVNDVVKCLINVSNSTDKLLNCYNPQVQSTKEFVEEHNKYNKEVILLDVVREFDKQEQVIDETIPNIYEKYIKN